MIIQNEFSLTGADGKLIIGDITFEDKNPNTPILLFVTVLKALKIGVHIILLPVISRRMATVISNSIFPITV